MIVLHSTVQKKKIEALHHFVRLLSFRKFDAAVRTSSKIQQFIFRAFRSKVFDESILY